MRPLLRPLDAGHPVCKAPHEAAPSDWRLAGPAPAWRLRFLISMKGDGRDIPTQTPREPPRVQTSRGSSRPTATAKADPGVEPGHTRIERAGQPLASARPVHRSLDSARLKTTREGLWRPLPPPDWRWPHSGFKIRWNQVWVFREPRRDSSRLALRATRRTFGVCLEIAHGGTCTHIPCGVLLIERRGRRSHDQRPTLSWCQTAAWRAPQRSWPWP